jgi:DNA-binding transcriptional regulator YiaG
MGRFEMKDGDYFCHSADAELTDAPFHYRRCGLDNIYLLNGFEIDEEDGDRYVTVLDVDGLHQAIGLHLVSNRKILSPKEIRFLRRTLDLTQAEMGRLINQSGQQVARWEKGENNINGPADRLLRLMFIGSLFREGVVEKPMQFLDRIDNLDDLPDDELRLCREGEDWLEAA